MSFADNYGTYAMSQTPIYGIRFSDNTLQTTSAASTPDIICDNITVEEDSDLNIVTAKQLNMITGSNTTYNVINLSGTANTYIALAGTAFMSIANTGYLSLLNSAYIQFPDLTQQTTAYNPVIAGGGGGIQLYINGSGSQPMSLIPASISYLNNIAVNFIESSQSGGIGIVVPPNYSFQFYADEDYDGLASKVCSNTTTSYKLYYYGETLSPYTGGTLVEELDSTDPYLNGVDSILVWYGTVSTENLISITGLSNLS